MLALFFCTYWLDWGRWGAESCALLLPPAANPDPPHLLRIQVVWNWMIIQFGPLKFKKDRIINIKLGIKLWKEPSQRPEA